MTAADDQKDWSCFFLVCLFFFQLNFHISYSPVDFCLCFCFLYLLSLVIFIDFNYNGKPAEKALRSLDQISLQDGTVRGRSSYTDSYGNPVAYDSIDDVDSRKPSNNKNNPHQYVIPGYASGILQSHEIPARNSDGQDEGRRIQDDRIHFVDPLHQNSFNNAPSTSLSAPGNENVNSRAPIEVPRPNIDANETPINDPSYNPTQLPSSDPIIANTQPSTILEVPVGQNFNSNPFLSGLVPPQIPSVDGVEIPRPNLEAHETPIDDSQNTLNQGLLPPTSSSAPNFNTFTNNQDGPVVITDEQTVFAPKPANGLLPPKDPLPSNFDFQAAPIPNNAFPSVTTSSKFSGNFEGTIGGGVTTAAPLHIPVQVIQDRNDGKIDKYTGSFGGAPGHTAPLNIPVQVIQEEKRKINKYTGTFGGSPGILVSDNVADRVIPTQTTSKIQPTVSNTVNNVLPTQSTHNKFSGSFGGSLGVLASNPTQAFQAVTSAPNIQGSNLSLTSNNKKVQLTFGGPAGVLRPFDNLQKN